MSKTSPNFVALLVVGLAAACASVPPPIPDRPVVDHHQWRVVETSAPLVGEALLQGLLALSEKDPELASQAREQALDLARRAGVVTTPRTVCQFCALPRNEGEVPNHMVCLAQRLNCLQPR